MLFAEPVMRQKTQAGRTGPEPDAQFRWEERERFSGKFSERWAGARERIRGFTGRTGERETL